MSAAIKSVKQNISIVWGQLRVSAINLDITEEEFQELTRAIRNATERLLGPESEIRRRLDRDRHNHGGSLS